MVKMLFDEEIFQRPESLADQPEKNRPSFCGKELEGFSFTSDSKMTFDTTCLSDNFEYNLERPFWHPDPFKKQRRLVILKAAAN